MNFEHEVPSGGYIRFDLPSSMSIKAPAQIADECYRREGESVDSLDCVASNDKTYFDINTNLQPGETITISVTGIRNPRFTDDRVLF